MMRDKRYKVAILFGSSNNQGNIYNIAQSIADKLNVKIYNLAEYNISNFDYTHQNKSDDFFPLTTELIDNYDTIIFVTPVYWYAMSAIMKTFFDRISDLLTIEKVLGRKLRGKKVIFVTSSIGNHLDDDFWIPVKATCNYLGMNFFFGMHCIEDKISADQLNKIGEKI
jgi:multimeric flavodoxin WrbA